jgi:homocysteine S-methyltransferase
MSDAFKTALRNEKPLLIDGGLATQCEAQGYDLSDDLWSAALLMTQPRAIVDAHRAYLDAGARCIVTASYQASREGFMSLGLSRQEADSLISSSIDLARQARDVFLADHPGMREMPLIAASVGPYGATLQDGSEYTGDYKVETRLLREFHRERLLVLDDGKADVLACETIPSLVEAEILCELLASTVTPAWISFSCRDEGHISDGTSIEQVAGLFRNHPRVMAVGVNCTPPDLMHSLIKKIAASVPDKAVIVYPNSGETYHAQGNFWSGTATPIECGAAALEWVSAGAKIVGGCCRMGPAHIQAMREAMETELS